MGHDEVGPTPSRETNNAPDARPLTAVLRRDVKGPSLALAITGPQRRRGPPTQGLIAAIIPVAVPREGMGARLSPPRGRRRAKGEGPAKATLEDDMRRVATFASLKARPFTHGPPL